MKTLWVTSHHSPFHWPLTLPRQRDCSKLCLVWHSLLPNPKQKEIPKKKGVLKPYKCPGHMRNQLTRSNSNRIIHFRFRPWPRGAPGARATTNRTRWRRARSGRCRETSTPRETTPSTPAGLTTTSATSEFCDSKRIYHIRGKGVFIKRTVLSKVRLGLF